jgi:hypothetical protein
MKGVIKHPLVALRLPIASPLPPGEGQGKETHRYLSRHSKASSNPSIGVDWQGN